ncbi:MAG TPA: Uma2 family endonuclease [Fimbriiglobus sp.]|nr:Uma2 family endonuclease [Fimbriiglobus sp.]
MSPATQAQPQSETLLTAEQYAGLPDDGRATELVKGKVVDMPSPKPEHGYYCANIVSALQEHVRPRDLGRVVSNDSGVVTTRGPDSVRGPDVAYYSYERVPKGPLPKGYWPAPELVFEVRSPSDRLSDLYAKISEYIKAGVKVVCLVDPDKATVLIYPGEEFLRMLGATDDLTLSEVLPEFRVPVRQLFE